MKNGFIVKSIRRHLYKPDTIIVEGAFPYDNNENKKLHAYVNGEEADMSINVASGFSIAEKYVHYQSGISEEIIGEFTIPKSGINSIELREESLGKYSRIKKFEGKRLIPVLTTITYSIDYQKRENGNITITGWAAVSKNAVITVMENGKSIAASIERKYRKDVKDLFVEATPNEKFGIEIAIPEAEYHDLKLVIQDNEKIKKIRLDLDSIQTEEDINKSSQNFLLKTIRYYRGNGFVATAGKIVKKILKKENEEDAVEYAKFLEQHKVTEEDLELQRNTHFDYEPVISIVIPIYNTPHEFLKELIDSVLAQTYNNWQLCLADGSDTDSLKKVVEELSNYDKRVDYKWLGYNDGISNNTNGAIEMAKGEFIAFSDHDDLITPDALYEVVAALNTDNNIDCVYSDEDKIDMDGSTLFMPHFKPDFDIDLLCSYNYITHLFVARKSLIDQVGWLDKKYDGSQDHDMILRCTEKARCVYHVPKVLYHWRCHKNSTAMNPESKMYCYEAGRDAVQAHWNRLGVPATVSLAPNYGHYITHYNWADSPLVSIIIPNMNHKEDLSRCIESILNKSTYSNYEILIIENNSTEEEIFNYYREIEENSRIKVIRYDGAFNYSRINNFGVEHANGEYLLFLNNDTELIAGDSIKEMVDICRRDDVGAVGARLYYKDNKIQHAGVILGVGGVANHAFHNTERGDVGYFFRSVSVQDLSAVTAACMMTKKSLFTAVNGFSEDLEVAFNDIDYCLKLRDNNKLVVFTPYSEWYHYESKSRGYEDTPEKKERLRKETDTFMSRWGDIVKNGDPYYNPNFNHKSADFKYDIAE